jgi:glycosyltransferase involved in cell wall biosynthesis
MISFIVPAHNEARWIGKCLGSIRASMEKLGEIGGKPGEPYEMIVVDDASIDATRQIAEQAGARMLAVECRNVSAVRNAGARAARGEILFFVDADTQVNPRAIAAGLVALRDGAAGGGCVFDLDGPAPLWARVAHLTGCIVGRRVRWVGGCFLFCTREAYHASGGFCENFSVGEDIAFCQAIKRVGRFVVPRPTVITSARKLAVVTPWEVFGLMLTIALRGPRYESPWALDLVYGRRARDSRERGKAAWPAVAMNRPDASSILVTSRSLGGRPVH